MAQLHQKNEEDISLSMNGTVLKPNISCKLLGVHTDENMNFSEHVTSLCKKTSKQIAIVTRFKKLSSTSYNKTLLYKACILPHTCCSTVWMHCGKRAAAKLEKLNKHAINVFWLTTLVPHLYQQSSKLWQAK